MSKYSGKGGDDKEEVKEEIANNLEEAGFTDGVDVSAGISLFEYGVLRNPDTGETVIGNETYDVVPAATINISKKNVLNALNDTGDGFYSFIGSSKEREINRVKKNPKQLATIINSLNMYSGTFRPHNPTMDLEDLKSYAERKV